MSYQAAIHLYKVINEIFIMCSSEHALFLSNIICPRRQLKFEIFRNNNSKIGMNMLANKFYHISKQISLDALNLTFIHFKRLMKFQFMKTCRTWNIQICDDPNTGQSVLCKMQAFVMGLGWLYKFSRWQVA